MPSHLNVDTKYWTLTDEIPNPPVERDIKTWIIGNPSDPLWDIDVLPLTYTNSRWSAFVVDVPGDARQRLCPNPPLTISFLSHKRSIPQSAKISDGKIFVLGIGDISSA